MELFRRRLDLETKIEIYGSGTNRSTRVIWTAAELGLDYKLIATEELIADPELRSLHPQGKIPSAKVGDLMLFESVAICEYLCDIHPNNRLLGESGSADRAIHTQWASFAQSEIEAYLWHNFQLDRNSPEANSFAGVKDVSGFHPFRQAELCAMACAYRPARTDAAHAHIHAKTSNSMPSLATLIFLPTYFPTYLPT